MSTPNRQTWDDANYRKMWVAFFNTNPGVHFNTGELAAKMGATKRAVEDQMKTLRREARALETPTGASAAQHDSDSVDEADLNVYQRAKRGLPPLEIRQSKRASAPAKGKDAVGKKRKRLEVSKPIQQPAQQQEDDDDDDDDDDVDDEEGGPGAAEGQVSRNDDMELSEGRA